MKSRKILTAVLCAALVTSMFAGCEKNKQDTVSSTAETKKAQNNASLSQVEVKNYSFPEFMNDIEELDMLSSIAYSDFNEAESVKEVVDQPFDDYNCLQCIGDAFYTFEESGGVGILNKNGIVLVEADTYESAQLVSNRRIKLSYPQSSGLADDCFVIEGNYGSLVKNYAFSDSSVIIKEVYDEERDETLYQLWVDNVLVSDYKWESIDKINVETLDTLKNPQMLFKAVNAGVISYVAIDKYLNVTIFNGVYGQVKAKIGKENGECYIFDYDHYTELNKMIDSFGSESSVSRPSKDEALDYIQITFGSDPSNLSVITISSDGYCLTENPASNDSFDNKYFSVLNKEAFVDLVNWVNETISFEYE